MTPLAVLLLSVGLADASPRARVTIGLGTAIAAALLLGAGWHTVWIVVVALVVVARWLRSDEDDDLVGPVVLGVAVLGLLVASPLDVMGDAPLRDWYRDLPVPALDGVPLERAALVLGAFVFLGTAANVLVRRALEATGPTVLAQERSLRGGRLLGPLERWLVLGFALGGDVGALGALAAAKGVLRFPEISRDTPDGMRAEYVLVGSFVSWTLALAVVPLV